MAHIVPFRAFRYSPHHVSPAQVVTQPYDKITPAMQDRYYAASPYNLVRIILGKREAADDGRQNVYTRAAASFENWRRQGILQHDSEPALYPYAQRFISPGGTAQYERRGFIALGRLEDYSAGVVYRHEQTLAKPKADRLDLLRATRAHFGQIFMLYEDSSEIDGLLATKAAPIIEVTDEYGVLHRVWQVCDGAVLHSVCGKMRDKKLIIADGHHRYETALNYRNERRAASSAAGAADAPYEFAMMTFVNMNSTGLLVLPTHRVVHGLDAFLPESFRASVRTHFRVEEVDAAIDAARAAGILEEAGKIGTALLAVTAQGAFLLHSPQIPSRSDVFAGLSARQQSLDVVQLHKVVLEKSLGLSEESIRNQQNISYLREADEALGLVRGGAANIAFLMNACRIEQVRDIAFAGEVLPQKSTDFYPKLLSGLTIYALE